LNVEASRKTTKSIEQLQVTSRP